MCVAALGLSACWGGDLPDPEGGPVSWQPSEDAPDDWVIVEVAGPWSCPDGEPSSVWIVRPRVAPDAPMPVAVVLHDGAFDFLPTPGSPDPLVGQHFQSPPRLTSAFAARQAWAVAGLWASEIDSVEHRGAIAVAFARRGVAVALPGLCWGDYGHNDGDNSALDGFERHGRGLTTWTWRVLSDAAFAESQSVSLGFAVDPEEMYLVGIGEGGRAAAEVLHQTSLRRPVGLLVDSAEDDLGVYWQDPSTWADRLQGMERIWTGGSAQAATGALANATLPARTAVVLSIADPSLPAGTLEDLVIKVQGAGGLVLDTGEVRHVQASANPLLAEQVVGYLAGDPPPDDTDTDGG